ncbi:MAG TPA: hypothetical protein VHO25_22520 [Polyangiaceae bacterium]|nr:hypothetical protein [Polyangiaceae bacterium]
MKRGPAVDGNIETPMPSQKQIDRIRKRVVGDLATNVFRAKTQKEFTNGFEG